VKRKSGLDRPDDVDELYARRYIGTMKENKTNGYNARMLRLYP
jgi:hypothetical protein